MSRLTDLLGRVGEANPELAKDLEAEVGALAARRSFGLNFERHIPEAVRLPGRRVRRGDKVVFLAPRDQPPAGVDEKTWLVTGVVRRGRQRVAELLERNGMNGEPEVTSRPVEDLVVIAEFRDPIYPGLRSTGKVERGGNKPWHAVINGENFHVLEALAFAYEGAIDCIYIDPPYNTRDKDWKYNNDYVDSDDAYRHSKWLAMMERRLQLAEKLLNPEDSVLLVTIDDKELHRIGLLLEQMFTGCRKQMVSITISPRGKSRAGEFSQVDEYLFVVYLGQAQMWLPAGQGEDSEVRWRYLRREDIESARGTVKGGPRQFYPIYVDDESGRIVKIGEPLAPEKPAASVPHLDGATAVLPIRGDGVEMNWSLTAPSLKRALGEGFVRVTRGNNENQPFIFAYLTRPNINKVAAGELTVTGTREDGSKIVALPGGKAARPTTVWRESRHDAGAYGTGMLGDLIPARKFPFPKSLYAVEDALRYFVGEKPEAVVLDFFAGSGTTTHAVMRLNRQDGGRRRSICVTNNEVSDQEAKVLRSRGLRPGDLEWEALGICEYITKPRIAAAITGRTPDGEPVEGDYKFTDEFPYAEGFEENAEFFDLTYEDPEQVRHALAFAAVDPLLWLRADARGPRVKEPSEGFVLADAYAVLFEIDAAASFVEAVRAADQLALVYVVTDEEKQFQIIADQLPRRVEAVRLYESYLRSFRVNTGEE